MKQSLGLLALCMFAPLVRADSVSTYGDAAVVTGPDSNPAWQLTSDTSGPNTYGGVVVTITGTLTPTTLTELSADYVMLNGTFGNGAPRFSLWDASNNEAYIYWGTPIGGGSFTDPNNGNTTYANTGNYADLSSSDVRVYSNDFGGDNNPNTGQTWSQFVGLAGSAQIYNISLDLDGGAGTNNQVVDTTQFDINGAIYSPSAVVPEPGSLGLMLCLFALLGVAGPFLRRRLAV